MSLIDATYFKLGRSVGGSQDTNSLIVDEYVPVFEKEYLVKALGLSLYTAFVAGIAAGSPLQKWLDLRDGVNYTVSGKAYRWDGFVNTLKMSPIADYVYIQYMRNNATLTTASGEAKSKTQNAEMASPAMKISKASIDMNNHNKSLWHYLDNNKDTYTEYDSTEVACFGSYNVFSL